ncbi:MAG: hypothetical protein DMF76_09145 [Acidobacteria bacterium]|nr:MAG: hypothetical protein DMF76_09145 [Acidobacteriota bacterium]
MVMTQSSNSTAAESSHKRVELLKRTTRFPNLRAAGVLLALQIELHSDERLYLRLVPEQKFEFIHSRAGEKLEEKIFVSLCRRAQTHRCADLDIESFVVQTEINLRLNSLPETTERW